MYVVNDQLDGSITIYQDVDAMVEFKPQDEETKQTFSKIERGVKGVISIEI